MQTNSKTQSRFNFIDVIVILTLLAIIAVFGYILLIRDSSPADNKEAQVTYTIKIAGVNEKYLDFFVIGNTVHDSTDNSILGTIKEISSQKTKFVTTENKLTVGEYPDIYDVFVTVTSACDIDNRNIVYIGNTKIIVGSPIYFSVTSFSHISYCTEFSYAISVVD